MNTPATNQMPIGSGVSRHKKKDTMYRILYLWILIFIPTLLLGQNLYPEKFNTCVFDRFCLDCGNPKAEPPTTFLQELVRNMDSNSLKKVNGLIEIQILIDSVGKPCLISVNNKTNIKTTKLKLQEAVNNTSNWKPAIDGNKGTNTSVSLLISFEKENIKAKRISFDPKDRTNGRSTGTPVIKGSGHNKLSETWTVYTQQNSDLPWDMTRAVAIDSDNSIWIGTDNGIVSIENGKWKIFNAQNSNIETTKYDKNATEGIRDIEVDRNNNKWFVAGWDVYKYDNKTWTIYDSINSPINWARTIFVDKSNNVWFTSWDGIVKYDGTKWSVMNTKNSEIPSNKTLGVFVDSKNRLWIGTFEGNIMIENEKTTKFTDKDSPLSKAYISQMVEDKQGNLWFDLYNSKGSDEGIYILRANGIWERIKYTNPDIFIKNSINYFLLDEEKNVLWIALNGIGILRYELENKKWEVYTNQNSNVPSVYVMKLAKDKDGAIWAATFAGVIKLNIK